MCLFCNQNDLTIIYQNNFVYAIYDGFPVNLGHTLIITKRHVSNYFDLTIAEKQSIDEALMHMKSKLDKEFHPDGYNIGINNGDAAGQTIMHLHVHLIPRYDGDTPQPRGGVRGVIPGKMSY
ncbi:MAG: HIT family protein [Acholeplasmataceae bacterium]|jgi:diadenosine tetraphosphate (Ap4A) HIT family hydrolase|nr:HIT family protein [Acholeplasmataceae bacterium]